VPTLHRQLRLHQGHCRPPRRRLRLQAVASRLEVLARQLRRVIEIVSRLATACMHPAPRSSAQVVTTPTSRAARCYDVRIECAFDKAYLCMR
jgi:hypothetical protein